MSMNVKNNPMINITRMGRCDLIGVIGNFDKEKLAKLVIYLQV